MTVTEEEARKKWCPIKWRNILTDGHNSIRVGDVQCSASACMMWIFCPVQVPDGEDDLKWVDGDRGYCGLAGGLT